MTDHLTVLNIMLQKIAVNLKAFSACEDVISHTLALFQVSSRSSFSTFAGQHQAEVPRWCTFEAMCAHGMAESCAPALLATPVPRMLRPQAQPSLRSWSHACGVVQCN